MNSIFEHLDTPAYDTPTATRVAGVSVALTKKWARNGVSLINPEWGDVQSVGGVGKKTLYTARGVVRLALVAEQAIKWKIDPHIALESAVAFTDEGFEPEAGYPTGETRQQTQDRLEALPEYRNPGGFFKTGETWLVATDLTQPAEIINIKAGEQFQWPDTSPRSLMIIDLKNFAWSIYLALQKIEAAT